jgi:hypothetical protein
LFFNILIIKTLFLNKKANERMKKRKKKQIKIKYISLNLIKIKKKKYLKHG